jgi:uncharacterized protein (DUF362 family)
MERRRFIAGTMGIGLGLTSLGVNTVVLGDPDPRKTAKVVIVRDPASLKGNELVHDRVAAMVDRAVTAVTGESDPREAWRKIIAPSRLKNPRVAIKVNALAGKRMSTHPMLAMVVARKLLDAGIQDGNVLVWDRSDRELIKTGYYIDKSGPIHVLSTDHLGYSARLYSHRSIGSRITRILTDWATDLINIPVLKDHGIVGISLGMKNMYGAVHNPYKYHPDCGNPFAADLSDIPLIRDKLRLVIVDAFQAQYNGGPPYHQQWAWNDGSVMMSTDPVAVDRVGWKVIEDMRREHGMPTLLDAGREPKYIFSAERLGLGIADLDRIETVDA